MEIAKEMSSLINIGVMRHRVLLLAMGSLIAALDDRVKRTFAEDFRQRVDDLLSDAQQQGLTSPDIDALVTLDLAELLEAADQPPEH